MSPDSGGFQALFFAAVPYVPDVARVVIREDVEVIVEATASATPPTVAVLAPNGSKAFPDGIMEISWDAADADDNPLTFIVQYSPDDGATWISLASLGSSEARAVEIAVEDLVPSDSSRVQVLASDGIHQSADASEATFSVGTTGTGAEDDSEVPTESALGGAAPNPTGGRMTLPLALPVPADVHITVYDLLGREVAVLVDRSLPAGAHSIELDASRLASGVYIIRAALDPDGQRPILLTQRITIIR